MRTNLLAALLLFSGSALAVVGGGDVVFSVKDPGNATFSHEAHAVKAKLGCKECHPRLYLDVAKSKHFTMKEMEKGQSCGACHQGQRAFDLQACDKCHR